MAQINIRGLAEAVINEIKEALFDNNQAIAIFDRPGCCQDCPCSYFTEGLSHDFCQLAGYETKIEYGKNTPIPEWCPLIVRKDDEDIISEELRTNIEKMDLYQKEKEK